MDPALSAARAGEGRKRCPSAWLGIGMPPCPYAPMHVHASGAHPPTHPSIQVGQAVTDCQVELPGQVVARDDEVGEVAHHADTAADAEQVEVPGQVVVPQMQLHEVQLPKQSRY